MNIFKRKLSEAKSVQLPFEPIELFQTLYHKEGYSYLRGIQEEVLSLWHEKRAQRDVLCKMNTGSGKTLVSLMMIYSKMIEGAGPGLYLCPDNQLLNQAKFQAENYGIPVCFIDEANNFPSDFLTSKSILLCTFKKMFTGRSIFEKENIQVGAIVLDDAHKCLEIARESTTLVVLKNSELFDRMYALFKADLGYQAAGTLRLLMDGDPQASILKVPYWSWMTRNTDLINIISDYATQDNLDIYFKWPLMADDLNSFDCYLGPRGFEISPAYVPYEKIKTFNEAKHRFILSATFEGQANLIRDLGISGDSIVNVLTPKDRKDVGQRLILAPRRFDPKLSDMDIANLALSYASSGVNVVVLVPSRKRGEEWQKLGATLVDKTNIQEALDNLKSYVGNIYVLQNRYDGIDLSGDMCRVLVIDGYPSFKSYKDLYTEVRLESISASLKAQIIDQGLGRAVRSGTDYCTVFLIQNNLLQFVGNSNNLEYFTPVTRKQLDLGISILDGEDTSDSIETIKETVDACLNQTNEWREFHLNILAEIDHTERSERFARDIELATIELKASTLFRQRKYAAAAETILNEIVHMPEIQGKQKGWFYELAAKYYFLENIGKSNDFQIKAADSSTHMLQPQHGYRIIKLSPNAKQISLIQTYVQKFTSAGDYKVHVEDLKSKLEFNPDISHIHFEHSFAELGRLIGFNTQEPEKEMGNGPDVLWSMSDGHFLVVEAKSRSEQDKISRDSIGQLLGSGEWFKNAYGDNMEFSLVIMQSPSIKEKSANTSKDTKVINEESLNLLKDNLTRFADGIISYGFHSASEKDIATLIQLHFFNPKQFRDYYLKEIKVK